MTQPETTSPTASSASTSDWTIPAGFRLGAVHAGLKRKAHKEDVALVVAERPATAAGVYTQNLYAAAPVRLCRAVTPSDRVRALLVNSGNANACTGTAGEANARAMAERTAETVGCDASQVLVMSTGIIGVPLPMEKIDAGITGAAERLQTDASAVESVARGIMTTDRSMKVVQTAVTLTDGGTVRLLGLAKGAGMIGPNMATMLGIVLTDAAIDPATAQRLLKASADVSFNRISVEGHTSTNDSLVLLASGASGATVTEADAAWSGSRPVGPFAVAVASLCTDLAKMIPDDGEGASHLMVVEVTGCRTVAEADRIARTIAESNLVKCAVAGNDPNWGRIVSGAGNAGVPFDPTRVDLTINGHTVFRAGQPIPFDGATVSAAMKAARETHLHLTLAEGAEAATVFASDLTPEYVTFNSQYST